MTIEDLPDFPLEGNSLIGRYPFLFQGSDTPVIFSISAAPMPSDCGRLCSCVYFLWTGNLTSVLYLFIFLIFIKPFVLVFVKLLKFSFFRNTVAYCSFCLLSQMLYFDCQHFYYVKVFILSTMVDSEDLIFRMQWCLDI